MVVSATQNTAHTQVHYRAQHYSTHTHGDGFSEGEVREKYVSLEYIAGLPSVLLGELSSIECHQARALLDLTSQSVEQCRLARTRGPENGQHSSWSGMT